MPFLPLLVPVLRYEQLRVEDRGLPTVVYSQILARLFLPLSSWVMAMHSVAVSVTLYKAIVPAVSSVNSRSRVHLAYLIGVYPWVRG